MRPVQPFRGPAGADLAKPERFHEMAQGRRSKPVNDARRAVFMPMPSEDPGYPTISIPRLDQPESIPASDLGCHLQSLAEIWEMSDHLDHGDDVESLFGMEALQDSGVDAQIQMTPRVLAYAEIGFNAPATPSCVNQSLKDEACGSADVEHRSWVHVFLEQPAVPLSVISQQVLLGEVVAVTGSTAVEILIAVDLLDMARRISYVGGLMTAFRAAVDPVTMLEEEGLHRPVADLTFHISAIPLKLACVATRPLVEGSGNRYPPPG